jgi:hypothetical protein
MRTAIALALVVLLPAGALAAPPTKLYYVGEVKLSSGTGQSLGSQAILMEKVLDPDNSVIVERAIVVGTDGKVDEYTTRLAVKKDNTFTVVDDPRGTEGGGKLFGPAWKWTYFKATFKAKNGVRIEDENFMADDSVGTARKKVIGPDDKVILYMDMSLKGTTAKTFEALRAGLMKKK